MTDYAQLTAALNAYVDECAHIAEDTIHDYKKKEQTLRADGASRLWIALFVGQAFALPPEMKKQIESDLVAIREKIRAIDPDQKSS